MKENKKKKRRKVGKKTEKNSRGLKRRDRKIYRGGRRNTRIKKETKERKLIQFNSNHLFDIL